MILYCIRHAESSFNSQGRVQGQLDPDLSELGVRQSRALAAALAACPFDAVYASPLRRARQTADAVAEVQGLEVRLVEELKELNAGIFQGRTWQEIHAEYPQESARWASHDPDFQIPQGESRRELMVRGRAALDRIRQAGHRQAAVVAHGGILAAAFKSLLEIPAERNPFSFYNASISKLSLNPHVKLLTLNQVEHLQQLTGAHDARSGDL